MLFQFKSDFIPQSTSSSFCPYCIANMLTRLLISLSFLHLTSCQQDYTVKRDWSLKISPPKNGFGMAESPFRPFHAKPKIAAIDGRFIAFMCSSPFEVVAVDVENGQILWKRILEMSNQSNIFAQKCRVGYVIANIWAYGLIFVFKP